MTGSTLARRPRRVALSLRAPACTGAFGALPVQAGMAVLA
jgi:hypothetical protein